MRVSGFTIVRDGVRFGYPFVESIRSVLPLVDEFIVAVGDCTDNTLQKIREIGSPKLVIFESVWDPEMKAGGLVMSHQTNLALDRCTGDWCFYLQADEVVHEDDLDRIRRAMLVNLPNRSVAALSFRYKHFTGSYRILNPLGYRRQVRIVRNHIHVRSVGDACGFALGRKNLGTKVDGRVRRSGAWIYHYGWARAPQVMGEKHRQFSQFYHGDKSDAHASAVKPEPATCWNYDLTACVPYEGSHPAVMGDVIAAQDWETPLFQPTPFWRNGSWWRGRLRKAGFLRAG